MSVQDIAIKENNLSLLSFGDKDNNCDYVIREDFDVKEYLSDTLNVDFCDSNLTGNVSFINCDIQKI